LTALPKSRTELAALHLGLRAYKLKVDQAMMEAKLQVQGAARRAAATHRYSDPSWFRALQIQTLSLGQESQRTQILMGEVSRRIRQINGTVKSYADSFVELARVLLPESEFERISAAAHRAAGDLTLAEETCSPTVSG